MRVRGRGAPLQQERLSGEGIEQPSRRRAAARAVRDQKTGCGHCATEIPIVQVSEWIPGLQWQHLAQIPSKSKRIEKEEAACLELPGGLLRVYERYERED